MPADGGVITVFCAFAVVVLLTVTVVGLHVAAAVIARQEAENAADLGALAGAMAVFGDQARACSRAATVAAANGASLSDCEVIGLDVRVQVGRAVHIGPIVGEAVARARAGPVAGADGSVRVVTSGPSPRGPP